MGKNRLLDRLGYIRVYHKDTGEKRSYPISPKIYNNKEKMAQLGYYDIPAPEAPVVDEEKEETPQAETPTPKKRGRKKVEDGN